MSIDLLNDVNWWAVLVGGVGYYALGAIWYSPLLFRGAYQTAVGMAGEAQQRQSVAEYLIPLLMMLVASLALALLALATGSDTVPEGVNLGLVAGIGISLMVMAVDANYDVHNPMPWVLFSINGVYHALAVAGLGVLHALWR